MEAWSEVRESLSEIRAVMAANGSTDSAARVQELIELLASGDEARFAREVSSGEVWGHMGSLFDWAPGGQAGRRFDHGQLRLADALSRLGLASVDVQTHAALVRGETPPGWRKTTGG